MTAASWQTRMYMQGFWSVTALPPLRASEAPAAPPGAQHMQRSLLWVEQDIEPKIPEKAPRNVVKRVLRSIHHKEMAEFHQARVHR